MDEVRSPFDVRAKSETADLILRDWLKSKVYLASSSSYRRAELEAVGFQRDKIMSVPISDEVEQEAFSRYQAQMGERTDDLDKRWSDQPVFVAEVKARALIAQLGSNLPADAFVIAADTMPMNYLPKDAGSFDDSFLAQAMPKPRDENHAEEVILQTFLNLADNYFQRSEPAEEQKIDYGDIISIKTGLAIRFPNDNEIAEYQVKAAVRMQSLLDVFRSVHPHDDKDYRSGLERSLKELAHKVVALSKAEGVDVTKISGGINYGNDAVRALLGVRDFVWHKNLDDDAGRELMPVEKGIYLGLPKEYLSRVLKLEAESRAA